MVFRSSKFLFGVVGFCGWGFGLPSQAATLRSTDFEWTKGLNHHGVSEIFVCGNAKIGPTKASLSKNFFNGKEPTGYLVSNAPTVKEYFVHLRENSLSPAKLRLEDSFRSARLWRVTRNQKVEDLGTPSKIEFPFSATIKDCMEGAKTTLGTDCSRYEGAARDSCCAEKFVGPRVSWGKNGEFTLLYSPDPSVRLRVSGEKSHRFCDFQGRVRIR